MLAGVSQAAWAHAILMESTPAANATVSGPGFAITLRYNVRVDGTRSRLHLLTPDGTDTILPIAKQTSDDILQAAVKDLKPGAYTLRWQVLASDGHMSRGDVPFKVK
jgi:methionine-rich copper-binding protein CopC